MSKADFEKTLGNAASNLRHVSAWIGRGEGFKSRIDQFLSQTQASLSETKNYPMSQSNPLRLQINKLTSNPPEGERRRRESPLSFRALG